MMAMVLVLLLSGCAGIRAVTPYTTEETEKARAECLAAGHLWIESQDRAACRPISKGEPA